jgi:ElaB/YqjD/DUF883 family membrane-anchored ribosome-binding protein
LLVSLSSSAWSQTTAPGPSDYPDPHCTRPNAGRIDKPQTHYSAGGFDAGAVGSYNSRIKAFNKESAAYNSCMHAYIDQANAEVKRIQDQANAELKQITERANASMKAIQDKIKQAVADANSVSAGLDAQTAKLRNR